jgi:hypothetical protein
MGDYRGCGQAGRNAACLALRESPMRLAPSPYFPVSQKFKTLISLSAMQTQPLDTALVLAHQLADEISGDDEQQDSVDST